METVYNTEVTNKIIADFIGLKLYDIRLDDKYDPKDQIMKECWNPDKNYDQLLFAVKKIIIQKTEFKKSNYYRSQIVLTFMSDMTEKEKIKTLYELILQFINKSNNEKSNYHLN